jgi:hypothetical protein
LFADVGLKLNWDTQGSDSMYCILGTLIRPAPTGPLLDCDLPIQMSRFVQVRLYGGGWNPVMVILSQHTNAERCRYCLGPRVTRLSVAQGYDRYVKSSYTHTCCLRRLPRSAPWQFDAVLSSCASSTTVSYNALFTYTHAATLIKQVTSATESLRNAHQTCIYKA